MSKTNVRHMMELTGKWLHFPADADGKGRDTAGDADEWDKVRPTGDPRGTHGGPSVLLASEEGKLQAHRSPPLTAFDGLAFTRWLVLRTCSPSVIFRERKREENIQPIYV